LGHVSAVGVSPDKTKILSLYPITVEVKQQRQFLELLPEVIAQLF